MANIPHKFTQEAEDSRDRDRKLAQHNATTLVFGGHCFKDCANRGDKCRDCFKNSDFVPNG
jgi:hypothetical protein